MTRRTRSIIVILLYSSLYLSYVHSISLFSHVFFNWKLPLGKLNKMLVTLNQSAVQLNEYEPVCNESICHEPSGIMNLRNTCYMNSVLQSLFYCLPFRNALLESSYDQASVAYATQQLFKALVEWSSSSSNEKITRCMKDLVDRLGIDIRIQEDAQEFFLKLINSIDESKTTDGLSNPKIKNLFSGTMVQTIECVNVNFTKKRSQSFLDLSIKVDGNQDLLDGIHDLLEPEMLVGENQYKAGVHGYQDAARRSIIENLPDILFVHLKRFEYDNEAQTLKKIGSAMSFPFELTGLDKESIYDLVSVIVHEGSLNFGHYTSLSKVELPDQTDGSQTNSTSVWYEFNDHLVNKLQEDDVKKIGYGETRRSLLSSKNAYVLLYVRRK